jgi:hypothetical protein
MCCTRRNPPPLFKVFFAFKVYAYFVLQLDVEVVSCTPSTLKIAGSKPIKGFDVIFTDTVLFPEGGGQVCRSENPGLPVVMWWA